MTSLQQAASNVKQINFSDDTYAVIDPAQGAVSIHRGQCNGSDSDWGGQCIAWLELDKALAIAEFLQATTQPASDEDAYYDELARREDERIDAMADALSASWGHD